jgi:hypothetical protein
MIRRANPLGEAMASARRAAPGHGHGVYCADRDGEDVARAQHGRPPARLDRELSFQDIKLLHVAGVPVQRRLKARGGALPSIKS